MRWLVLLLLVGSSLARRAEHDFEFDDETSGENSAGSRPRRYVYDPHNPLCAALVCGAREVCVLRDELTALCANKKDILRNGDSLVAASRESWGAGAGAGAGAGTKLDDDFYDIDADNKPERCVGCSVGGGGGFVCGSDNRTYSSLCRLDLHNCVRRARPPVRLACAGYCPCPEKPRRNNKRWPRRRLSPGGARCSLDKMADRLLDWFSVLMTGPPPARRGFPAGCLPEVRWMFAHLDTDGDGLLSANNLYALRHDEREQCLRPFLASCSGGAGGAGGVSRAGWCACLRRGARPCTALAREHPAVPGGYVPACTRRGYFLPRQCDPARAQCWCVTPHGAELPGTRHAHTRDCHTDVKAVQPLQFGGGVETNEVTNEYNGVDADEPRGVDAAPKAQGVDAADGAPDDDEDGAGSGDSEVRF